MRRSFKDAKIQRLENIANEIAVGLAVIAEAKAAAPRCDAEWRPVPKKTSGVEMNKSG